VSMLAAGCMPSKNLLGASDILHSANEPSYPSVLPCDSGFDFAKIIADKDRLVRSLRKRKYQDVLTEELENVELIKDSAAFISKKI